MADRRVFSQIDMAHLPSLMLLIGYPLYWLTLIFKTGINGYTAWTAWLLWLTIVILVIVSQRSTLIDVARQWFKGAQSGDVFYQSQQWFYLAFVFGLLAWFFFVASYPLHLQQEYDALNYHYTLPRQHLIQSSFTHLPWSHADLFLMPLQYALAPFWFVNLLLNKVPQMIFLVGLLCVIFSLVRHFGHDTQRAWWAVVATMSTHAIMIQCGTAMLDLTIVYLFFAVIHSWFTGKKGLFVLESVFFLFAKPLMPIQMLLIAIAVLVVYVVFVRWRQWLLVFDFDMPFTESLNLKRILRLWLIVAALVAGPFMLKSWWYAGTPLYPLGAGAMVVNPWIDTVSSHWNSITTTAEAHLKAGQGYGEGKSLWAWVKHFWLLSVPTKGVNNAYDYPLGLTYLLFMGPFLVAFVQAIGKKKFSLLGWFIFCYWLTWWFGTQQSRFLYIPLILIYVIMVGRQIFQHRLFHVGLMLACCLTLASGFRAHKHLLGQAPHDVLRTADKHLITLSEKSPAGVTIYVNHPDVAYLTQPGWPLSGHDIYVLDTRDFIQKGK